MSEKWFYRLLAFSYIMLIQMKSVELYTIPACHKGIMNLFHWCEQSNCKSNCTCLSSDHVCKQICGQKNCGLLFCSSPKTCHQSVLINDRVRIPKIEKLVSHSPITQQDCSQGHCKLMKALRYDTQFTRSFQSCSEATCEHLYSTADHSKQFCGNCNKMTCTGKNAKNCTQLCILGDCKQVICNAKYCRQLCAHESKCNLTCGPNTEVCDQTCSHGSTCVMNCKGKSCKQKCNDANSCVRNDLRRVISTTQTTTTERTTTEERTFTSPEMHTTEMSNSVDDIDHSKTVIQVETDNNAESAYHVSNSSNGSSQKYYIIFLFVLICCFLL